MLETEGGTTSKISRDIDDRFASRKIFEGKEKVEQLKNKRQDLRDLSKKVSKGLEEGVFDEFEKTRDLLTRQIQELTQIQESLNLDEIVQELQAAYSKLLEEKPNTDQQLETDKHQESSKQPDQATVQKEEEEKKALPTKPTQEVQAPKATSQTSEQKSYSIAQSNQTLTS